MLCVLGGPRTHGSEPHEDAVAQLTKPKQPTAFACARRSAAHDTSVGAFMVSEALELGARPDPTCEALDGSTIEIPRSRLHAALSRGPPRG